MSITNKNVASEDQNASLTSTKAAANKLPILVNALTKIYKPYVYANTVEVGFLRVLEGGTSINTENLRTFLDDLDGEKGSGDSTHAEHVTVFQELVRQNVPLTVTWHVVIEGIQRMHKMVSERSERALRKTRAMDLAKWLQTATSTTN